MALLSDKAKKAIKIAVAEKPEGDEVMARIDRQASTVAAVATADADATYGQPEADLINELKSKLNAALAALKAAGLMT